MRDAGRDDNAPQTLELDDGKMIHLRQGDCIVQNGTRRRWRNPLPEPCLTAFISVGGKRG